MESLDILLLAPPSRLSMHYRPPLSLMYVANYYKTQGLNVKVLDYPTTRIIRNKKFWNDKNIMIDIVKKRILNDIVFAQPKFVGISCYSMEFEETKSLIKDIKEFSHFPVEIIVGGIHPTLNPSDFDGIAACIPGRLDNSIPDYSSVDMEYYSHANPYAIRGVFLRCAYIVSSFGCPSKCTFCVAPELNKYIEIEFKNPVDLYYEITRLKEDYEIDGFYIIDDLYTMNKQRVLDFCNIIKRTNLLWACNAKVNTLDEEMISKMAKSNCIQMDLGIERGTNEELKKLKKGITIEQTEEIFKLCKKYKIRTFANFLVGLPEETKKDREDILLLCNKLKPTVVSFNKFLPYFGTQLYKEGVKEDSSPELQKFISLSMKKYNNVWENIKFHLSIKYLLTILRSKRKLDYLCQLNLLIKELLNQWSA